MASDCQVVSETSLVGLNVVGHAGCRGARPRRAARDLTLPNARTRPAVLRARSAFPCTRRRRYWSRTAPVVKSALRWLLVRRGMRCTCAHAGDLTRGWGGFRPWNECRLLRPVRRCLRETRLASLRLRSRPRQRFHEKGRHRYLGQTTRIQRRRGWRLRDCTKPLSRRRERGRGEGVFSKS